MIIDAKKYAGKCTCGREHKPETSLCIIEAGALSKLEGAIAACGLSGIRTVVYDQNTYVAKGLIRPHADHEVVLDPKGLHANEHGVEALWSRLPKDTSYLVAVGAGTVHDITRYCAYKLGVPFVSCPTAASVDGFCSSVAAMTWEGCKKTLTAVAPTLVVADLEVISKAPLFLARSGFGDMIGKYIALADWQIAHRITGEFFCESIYQMMTEATRNVTESAEGIASGDATAYERLTYGLLLSGLAMQLMGNSRPASGAEHHISHLIETAPKGLAISSEAMHGEKVGVATVLACREYHRLADLPAPAFDDYRSASKGFILRAFGEGLVAQIMEENRNDAADGITGKQLKSCWSDVCKIVANLPTAEKLLQLYARLGVKKALSDIDVEENKVDVLLTYSPCVRNRLTLMRLRGMLKSNALFGGKIILAAHRGDRLKYPENTMPAFLSAYRNGVDMIETDVHMTRDGELVILHDRNAKRTAEMDRNVDEMTLAEVRELDAGAWFGKDFVGTRIPTAVEFLEWVRDTNLTVNWELKDYPHQVGDAHAFAAADRLIALIEEYGMGERSMLNSFSARVLEHIKNTVGDRYPLHGQGIDRAPKSVDQAETAHERLFNWVCLYGEERGHLPIEYEAGFSYCRSHGLIPCVCIPDTKEAYAKAIAMGSRMFTSNNIYEADRILRELGVR